MRPVADQITRRNERARAAAEKAGRITYQQEVVNCWPACTACGHQIRSRGLAVYRQCGCPGVRWYPTGSGWHREPPLPASTDGDT